MDVKKALKISGIVISRVLLLSIVVVGIVYYNFSGKYLQNKDKYPNYIGYINPETAVFNDDFTLCDEDKIYGTHHGMPEIAFHKNKKHFRETILNQYDDSKYSDNGYLNLRFLVNCKGQAGRFEINELTLDLEKKDLNDMMVNDLLKLTANQKNWNIFYRKELPKNYYMYILYRIENGKITEILP